MVESIGAADSRCMSWIMTHDSHAAPVLLMSSLFSKLIPGAWVGLIILNYHIVNVEVSLLLSFRTNKANRPGFIVLNATVSFDKDPQTQSLQISNKCGLVELRKIPKKSRKKTWGLPLVSPASLLSILIRTCYSLDSTKIPPREQGPT